MFENIKKQKQVSVNGWVEELRILGGIAFVILRNREGTIQLIIKKKENVEEFEKVKQTTIESVINVEGDVILNDTARNGFEIKIKKYNILNKSDALPLDIKGNTNTDLSIRFDNRYLDLRNKKNYDIFLLRSKLIGFIHEFFQKEGFIAVNTPKITTLGAESGAELFKLNYYGKTAYLSQSPQIYKQMLQTAGFEKVYEIGPVFRAEKSRTSRHLSEYIGLDIEMSFIYDIKEIMTVEEKMIKYIFNKLKQTSEFKLLELVVKIPTKIPILDFYDVKEILKKQYNKDIDDDLDAEAEGFLGNFVLKKYNSDFVFVINYPWSIRPFYHVKGKNNTTKSFDLLFKGQEITTGSLREHRYNILLQQVKEKGLNEKDLSIYLNMFKYGVPPHGGFGSGIDRIVEKLFNLSNIKEASLFPRTPDRVLL